MGLWGLKTQHCKILGFYYYFESGAVCEKRYTPKTKQILLPWRGVRGGDIELGQKSFVHRVHRYNWLNISARGMVSLHPLQQPGRSRRGR